MTNRDLAKTLGISPATLSLIINNKPGISDLTRERVIRQLSELGLSGMIKSVQANPSANRMIGFVVYKHHGKILDAHPFFLLLMETIESYAHKYDYDLKFLSVDLRNPIEDQIARLKDAGCRGLILFATEMQADDIVHFRNLEVPYVLLDNDFPRIDLDAVAINNELGTYQAVEYLVRFGHRKIGYLQSDVCINSFKERSEGYLKALRQFNLSLDPAHIFKLDYTEDGSYRMFSAMLDAGVNLPTAFFSDDDTIAAGAIKALREHDIVVPQDISVIGFNNRPVYQKSIPPLTTIDVPKRTFGASAVDLLLKRIAIHEGNEFRSYSLKYRIGTELIIRDSVKER